MQKFRLVTRSDFDGLVCAILLKQMGILDDIKFVHPKDMQDGIIEITENDIITNLPYVEKAHLVFDHHESETLRNDTTKSNYIIDAKAPSAARVVYDYYKSSYEFPKEWDDMMEAVDKADSAQFSKEDVLDPKGWDLLSFIMDARTGLGRFRNFTISNYDLMMKLIDACKDYDIDYVLNLPDVKERVDLYKDHEEKFKQMIKENSKLFGEVLVIDLRDVDPIYAGNRFIEYAMFEEAEISIHVMWGLKKQNTVFAVGRSIINKSSNVNIGEICLQYGGGGHKAAGTCQVPNENSDETLKEFVEKLQKARK